MLPPGGLIRFFHLTPSISSFIICAKITRYQIKRPLAGGILVQALCDNTSQESGDQELRRGDIKTFVDKSYSNYSDGVISNHKG